MKLDLFVADIFKSIQGEGPKIGTPSLFLRLGVCNLQCSWCDTPYTWKKGQTDYQTRSPDFILKTLRQFQKGTGINHLVITGGEPLLQQKQLAGLLSELSSADFFENFTVEFETNGTQPLHIDFRQQLENYQGRITFNISPKLADSGNKNSNNRSLPVHIYPHSILKFIYVGKGSERLIDDFLKQNRTAVSGVPVFVMPEGTDIQSMSSKYDSIVRYCLKRGFRFTPRWHIYLFGDKRRT